MTVPSSVACAISHLPRPGTHAIAQLPIPGAADQNCTGLAEPAPVRARGDLVQAGAVAARQFQPVRDAQQRAERRLGQDPARPTGSRRPRRRRAGNPRPDDIDPIEFRFGSPSARSTAARKSASPPGGKRADGTLVYSGSSALGRDVAIASLTPWRRTPLRIRRSKIGASSSGSQPIIRIVAASSEIDYGGLERRRRQRPHQIRRQRRTFARVDVRGPERLAHQPRDHESFLVGGLTTDERADRARMPRQTGRCVQGPAPTTPGAANRHRGPAAALIRSSTWIA